MQLTLSVEQTLLRDSAAKVLQDGYTPAARQRGIAQTTGLDRDLWATFAELGWLALSLPEAAGGLGCGAVETGLLMEAFGRALVIEPYLDAIVLGAGALAALEPASPILPEVAAGQAFPILAHSEQEMRDGPASIAARTIEGWRLDGAKSGIAWAPIADHLVVSARLGDGMGLFLVPARSPGLRLDAYRTVDDLRAADIVFSDLRLGPTALLGDCATAEPVLDAVLDRGIAALCADAVGAMSALLDATVDYAKTRIQFGQPIGRFQALQHRMAEMHVEFEEARALALLAALKADAAPVERARAASAAKAKIGLAARFIAHSAVQLHGAMGVTDELPVGLYLKRLLAFQHRLGSSAYHRRRYAALCRRHGLGSLLPETEVAHHGS